MPISSSLFGLNLKLIFCLFLLVFAEIVNGRLAMLGFFAALGAELSTDTSILKQMDAAPAAVAAAFALFIAGSLITIMQRKEGKLSLGPFTSSAGEQCCSYILSFEKCSPCAAQGYLLVHSAAAAGLKTLSTCILT